MPEFQGRCLPVFMVLDTSGSMAGAPIEAVRRGFKALVQDLECDPMGFEITRLAAITFDDLATQAGPLTDLLTFEEPRLVAGGGTALGSALDLLIQHVRVDVRRSSATQKGDYKPLVFLLTDGQPTDDWQPAAERLKALNLTVVACAAGPYANVDVLRRVTENVVELKSLEPGALKAFFKYVSDSIRVASRSVANDPDHVKALGRPPAVDDLATTLAVAVHKRVRLGGVTLSLVASCQVGDGVVAVIHDEVVIELAEEGVDHAGEARRVEAILNTPMGVVTGGVPVACEYALSRRWSKKAKPVFSDDGRLVPWEAETR